MVTNAYLQTLLDTSYPGNYDAKIFNGADVVHLLPIHEASTFDETEYCKVSIAWLVGSLSNLGLVTESTLCWTDTNLRVSRRDQGWELKFEANPSCRQSSKIPCDILWTWKTHLIFNLSRYISDWLSFREWGLYNEGRICSVNLNKTADGTIYDHEEADMHSCSRRPGHRCKDYHCANNRHWCDYYTM